MKRAYLAVALLLASGAALAGWPEGGGLTTTALNTLYCQLVGCTLTGPLVISGVDPSATTCAAAANYNNLASGAAAGDYARCDAYDGTELFSVKRSGATAVTGTLSVSSTLAATGAATFSGNVAMSSQGQTASIGSNQNDYAGCVGLTVCKLFSTDVARTITGFTAEASGTLKWICNANNTNNFTISNDSASSAAANRVYGNGYTSITLTVTTCKMMIYDGTSTRWRALY